MKNSPGRSANAHSPRGQHSVHSPPLAYELSPRSTGLGLCGTVVGAAQRAYGRPGAGCAVGECDMCQNGQHRQQRIGWLAST